MQNNLCQRNNLDQFAPNQPNQKQIGFQIIPPHHQPLNPPLNQNMATFDLHLCSSNINPSTNDDLKIFLKLTKEHKEDEKHIFLQTNVPNLMSPFESDARKFGWNAFLNVVPSDRTG